MLFFLCKTVTTYSSEAWTRDAFEAKIQIRRTTFDHICRHESLMEYVEQMSMISVALKTVLLMFMIPRTYKQLLSIDVVI